jgi:hypothetical protein
MRDQAGSTASTEVDDRKAVRAARPKVARPPPPAPVAAPAEAPAAMMERSAQPERENLMAIDAVAEPFPPDKVSPQVQGAPGARDDLGKRDQEEQAEEAAGAARAKSLSAPAPPQSRVPAPSSSVQLRQNMHLPPEEWLAEIVRLKREGHRQQAIENLRLFRRMHPDWKLSDELLHLAQ